MLSYPVGFHLAFTLTTVLTLSPRRPANAFLMQKCLHIHTQTNNVRSGGKLYVTLYRVNMQGKIQMLLAWELYEFLYDESWEKHLQIFFHANFITDVSSCIS